MNLEKAKDILLMSFHGMTIPLEEYKQSLVIGANAIQYMQEQIRKEREEHASKTVRRIQEEQQSVTPAD